MIIDEEKDESTGLERYHKAKHSITYRFDFNNFCIGLNNHAEKSRFIAAYFSYICVSSNQSFTIFTASHYGVSALSFRCQRHGDNGDWRRNNLIGPHELCSSPAFEDNVRPPQSPKSQKYKAERFSTQNG